MSETCEHPLCTRLISSKCSNHCQLDLCQEHITEHKNLFLVQYEKSFNNLNRSMNDFNNSIEETKNEINTKYEQELLIINENHKDKCNLTEQKSLFINSTQNLIKKKLQLLSDVKHGQALLYQYDIEQIKLYSTKIYEYYNDKTINTEIIENNENDMELLSSSSSSDIDDKHHTIKSKDKRHDVIYYRGTCPLTRVGIYGLNNQQNMRLCTFNKEKPDRCLLGHFNRYHHIPWRLSYQLTEAIMNKLDPLTTPIFQSEVSLMEERFYIIRCPLHQIKLCNKTFNCKRKFCKDSLKQHLLGVHHLTLTTSNKIIDTIKNKGDLTKVHFDENEFD